MNAPFHPAYLGNSAFSSRLPFLQLAWDSTSMGEFKTCARKYYYTLVMGYVPRSESVHLIFGLLLHGAIERYNHFRTNPAQVHEIALLNVLKWAASATWNRELNRPWASDDKNKNRETLLRTIVWYLDEFGPGDPLETVILSNGKPAVELSFQFPLGWSSPATSEPMLIAGHLDRLAKLEGRTYIVDIKSTKNTIDAKFFSKFTPDNQFSTYMLAGRVAFSQSVEGLIVDGAQIAVTFSRFQRGLIQRSESQVHEWLDGLRRYHLLAEQYAIRAVELNDKGQNPELAYPMNDKVCGMYNGCAFQGICSKNPGGRHEWLQGQFKQRVWNPLIARGDV